MTPNTTIQDIRNAIDLAKQSSDFFDFSPPLGKQLVSIVEKGQDCLYFWKDVSNGCKQAFLVCWVKI